MLRTAAIALSLVLSTAAVADAQYIFHFGADSSGEIGIRPSYSPPRYFSSYYCPGPYFHHHHSYPYNAGGYGSNDFETANELRRLRWAVEDAAFQAEQDRRWRNW